MKKVIFTIIDLYISNFYKQKAFDEIFDLWEIKNVRFLYLFEIKRTKMDKMFNFLKDRSSVMSGPMDMIFGDF